MIFNKKKLYKITYKGLYYTYETLVAAKNPAQAIRKFTRDHCCSDVIAVEEYIV